MKNIVAAANAGLNNNTSDKTPVSDNREGTIVLSELDKKDRAEQVKILFDKVNKGQKVTLKDKIELSIYLLNTKRELKNEFYKFITPTIMSRKQVGRHIQLILTLDSISNYTKGMSTKYKSADTIENNLSLLIEDTRVTSLTVEQIDKMPEPTMKAVIRAKQAILDEEFIKILQMDKEALDGIKEKRNETSKVLKTGKEEDEKEELAKLKPKNMTTEKYENLLEEDKPTLISMLQASIEDLQAKEKELISLKHLAKTSKHYDGSKSKSEDKQNTEEG